MWRFLQNSLHKLRRVRHWRRMERALALNRRGEARPDGLELATARNRLEIEWRAREIHPWDRNLPAAKKDRLFEEQLLADTEAAIQRLFVAMPYVDVIDLNVVDPNAQTQLLSGTIRRTEWRRGSAFKSIRMRLQALGISFASAEF